jgi:hypothetical protein
VRDAQALTAAIGTYLGDPALRRRHGANGRRRARCEFEPGRLREALFQEYIRLLGRRGCGGIMADVRRVPGEPAR